MIESIQEALIALALTRRISIRMNTRPMMDDGNSLISKIGGTPYWEKSRAYPVSRSIPMSMVAQINWSDLNKQVGINAMTLARMKFPKTGITQFFIDSFANQIQLGITNPDQQGVWKVIHWENPDISQAIELPEEFKEFGPYFPASENLECFFSAETMVCGPSDSIEFPELGEVEESVIEQISYNIQNIGCHINGYPQFVYGDVRNQNIGRFGGHRLLLQIDSSGPFFAGANGSMQWMIHPVDLANRDFSKMIFSSGSIVDSEEGDFN